MDALTVKKDLITFTSTQLDLIKSTIAKDATSEELQLFLYQCKRTGLDPLARQIHFQKFTSKYGKSNVSFITTIDGYRLIAERSGSYVGNDDAVFEGIVPIIDADLIKKAPAKATVTVSRFINNVRGSYTASAYWEEYYPIGKRGSMWRKYPHVMLAKCAEAQALRKAFPNDLGGLYTQEEMDNSQLPNEPSITVPQPPPAAPTQALPEEVMDKAIAFIEINPHKVEASILKLQKTYVITEKQLEELRKIAQHQGDLEALNSEIAA